MTLVFWTVAALFVAAALLMLLPPLLAPRATGPGAAGANLAVLREQWREAGHDAAWRADLERQAVAELGAADAASAATPARRTALALALLLPLGCIAGYLALGDPRALAVTAVDPPNSGADGHAVSQAQIEQMAKTLGERLKAAPGDAAGWAMLARSYTALGRYRDAVLAFRRANELQPGQAALLADFADVLGVVQGKRLAGEPARLVQQALDADPRHPKALALAGSVAFEAREYAAAGGYWERLLAVIDPASPMARSVRGSLAQARQLEQSATPAGPGVAGQVALAPALAAQVRPGDTLFVVARAVDGPRMPVAILRRTVGGWPADFVLDDRLAVSQDARLSAFAKLEVTARVSRSAQALPAPGDLVAAPLTAVPGQGGLRLVIDAVRP